MFASSVGPDQTPHYVASDLGLHCFDYDPLCCCFTSTGKHLRSCRDGQLTEPHLSWAGSDLLSS